MESFTDIKILFFFMVEKVFCSGNFFFHFSYIKSVCKNYFDPISVTFLFFFCFEVGNASTAGIDFFYFEFYQHFFSLFANLFFLQKFCNNKCFFFCFGSV